jgi:tetratricopeptide (TPR) repeat protein
MRKKFRFVYAAALVVILLILGFGLLVAYANSQYVVTCANAPKKPISIAPVFLVTAQDYYAKGDYDYDQGACDQAISDYSRAIKLNPNIAEAYNNRAYVYMVEKNYAAALPDLDHAIQLRPNYVNALLNRADIYNYYYEINYQRAIADYDQVLKIAPDAANYTSVCGHRLIALTQGWHLNTFEILLTHGQKAGCPG